MRTVYSPVLSRWVRSLIWIVPAFFCLTCAFGATDGSAAASGVKSPDFVQGRRPDSIFSKAYVKLVLSDGGSLLTAPTRWDRQEWTTAAELGGTILAAGALDSPIRRNVQAHRSQGLDNFAHSVQRLGSYDSWAVMGGFELAGLVFHNPKAKATAMDSLTSSIIAAGIITPVLKLTVGRLRPATTPATYKFRPFSGNMSFPSGHATQAFAIASVIASHYRAWWQQGIAYGLASLVAFSRVEQNAHFTSDVVTGAIIGTVVGRAVVARNNENPDRHWSFAPYVGRSSEGLAFDFSY